MVYLWSVPEDAGRAGKCLLPEKNLCYFLRNVQHHLFRSGSFTVAITARCDIRADEPDYSTQSYRKAAYRQYTLWKYEKLGRGNRKILPSCVVTTIRQAYPAPDGNYMGFRRS